MPQQHCIECGKLLAESAKFCWSCGSEIQIAVTKPVVAPAEPEPDRNAIAQELVFFAQEWIDDDDKDAIVPQRVKSLSKLDPWERPFETPHDLKVAFEVIRRELLDLCYSHAYETLSLSDSEVEQLSYEALETYKSRKRGFDAGNVRHM